MNDAHLHRAVKIRIFKGMKMLTIQLSEETRAQLAALAREQGKSPEDLASEIVTEAIVAPKVSEEFRRTAREVIRDNAELYNRLS